ncbi:MULTISPECIES: hypothetical protein [unclassified Arthrobacter]|uniref:hypothetical protein n=1 Tax=unclassified Arthrobacter TaxID=235627 RepID=UPI002DFBFF74|nr:MULTISPECIES: hypothetical protein [unclassified Arthrobacter]MEC5193462.1 hypothetical protein [Arthrobacter sp. MP_M4]MEC5204938.1 hypothetical protein [Arthrobacter sp. MP_M7]
MSVLRRGSLPGSNSRRRWWIAAVALLSVITALIAVMRPTPTPAVAPVPPSSTMPIPQSPANTSTGTPAQTPTTGADDVIADADGAPRTADFRKLAAAAATAIYTWDTRTSSYSEVYSRLRGWWAVLPDGSNPLAVLVQEFEATGVNAGSYTTLADQQAYRSAAVESLRCDSKLAKVRERPAPWEGLHVCTVSLRVLDQSASTSNTYTAPVSVMVNCPPAMTAPPDHCVMVGFYASPSRIVY